MLYTYFTLQKCLYITIYTIQNVFERSLLRSLLINSMHPSWIKILISDNYWPPTFEW